jgi:hypothetical protein
MNTPCPRHARQAPHNPLSLVKSLKYQLVHHPNPHPAPASPGIWLKSNGYGDEGTYAVPSLINRAGTAQTCWPVCTEILPQHHRGREALVRQYTR